MYCICTNLVYNVWSCIYSRASLSMEHVSQLAQVIQSVDMITSEEASKYKQLMEVDEFGQFTEKLLQLVQEMISSKILKHSLQVCVCKKHY